MKLLRKLWNNVQVSILRSYEFSEKQVIALSTLGVFCYPILYITWKYIYPQPYESFLMRMFACLMCFLLVLKDYWPRKWQRYIPLFWYCTVLYCLPFFFSFMALKNHWSVISSMSLLVAIFIMILLVDWLSISLLFVLGLIAAIVIDALLSAHAQLPTVYLDYLVVYFFALLVGTAFNYKTNALKNEKMAAMSLISGSIAHELRTPLLGIKSGSLGLKRYYPILFQAYQLAKDHGLDVPKIRTAHFNSLLPALERIESETNNANTIIDMLLMNVGKQAIDPIMFEVCSMADCVDDALGRYPFLSSSERELIEWTNLEDFQFYGARLLMVHVIFNLLKNALHYIAKARTGRIRIWIAKSGNHHLLYFKDTGRGIPPDILPRVFERFFSTTISGTGIGLSFCKLVVESCGGTISCHSEEGVYTEFKLQFPSLK